MTITTMHIDIEGGWGGSSRSLFELVSRLDRSQITPIVLYRSRGPIAKRYAEIGVDALHTPDIYSFAPRPKNSFKIWLASFPRLLRAFRALDQIDRIARARGADLIHLNYEGLHTLAPALRRRLNLPIAVHSRTHIPDNSWGRGVVRRLGDACDYVFFISPIEELRFRALEKPRAPLPGEVMWNIVSPIYDAKPSHPPYAVYLGNIDRSKGVDRLLDLAAALNAAKAPELVIRAFGSARSDPHYAHELGRRIIKERLSDRLQFEGHTDFPELALKGATALIRPSRENDPWGRDVIEATASGVPVLATGIYDGVVSPGETGFLYSPFDAKEMAQDLIRLIREKGLFERISQNGRERSYRFSGYEQQRRFESIALSLSSIHTF